MSPYAVLGLALLAVMASVIFALAFSPRRKIYSSGKPQRADYGRDDVEPAIAGDGFHYKGAKSGPRFVSQTVHPTITLTPRQIERINTQRRLRGKPPFNREGLSNAIAHPWDRYDVKQPQTSNDWLSYLIAYEIFFDDHKSNTASGCQGINIDPNLPYNGHGGEYAGAGASGMWGDNLTRAEAAAIDHGVPLTTDPEYPAAPASDPYVAIAAAAAASVSDSVPSYSSSSDSSSSDSSSSSSSDSGSSGGGGDGS